MRTGLLAAGFVRALGPEGLVDLESAAAPPARDGRLTIVQDRLGLRAPDHGRLVESLEQALRHGRGRAAVRLPDAGDRVERFSSALECAACGFAVRDPVPNLFSFNSPLGACETCRGFGRVIDLDLDLVIPDPRRSLAEGAIKPWSTRATGWERGELLKFCRRRGIPTGVPWAELSPAQHALVLEGDGRGHYPGVRRWFRWLEGRTYRMHVRVFLSRFRSYTPCAACGGARVKPEALDFRVGGLTIAEVNRLPLGQAGGFFARLALPKGLAEEVAGLILGEIRSRLRYLVEVGLEYLTLDRQSRTLSGGELERVDLTTAIGASLANTLSVLDAPSVGLHPRDTERLTRILPRLRDLGNAVVVVEHDPTVIRAADHVIDLGPGAGGRGGHVVFAGRPAALVTARGSATAEYLTGRALIPVPAKRRKPIPRLALRVRGASANNLKDLDVDIPLSCFVAVTGVSGSGKSTLVDDVLYRGLKKRRGEPVGIPGSCRAIEGAERIAEVILVDQAPIGSTPRANPVTYLRAFDGIRACFARTEEARLRGYTAATFSFNVPGGRCETCTGEGFEKIEMQFLSDVYVPCAECGGARFRPEILEVRFRDRSIRGLLELTVAEASVLFADVPEVGARLQPLADVGLDYLRLGQPLSTLSGGEAQRVKLAAQLGREGKAHTLFIFVEPTTGLHLADIETLLGCFARLVARGHSLIVIEHHLEVVKCADWVIDLGPEGGEAGGRLVAAGPPETIARAPESHTGRFLAEALRAPAHGRHRAAPLARRAHLDGGDGDGDLPLPPPAVRQARRPALHRLRRGDPLADTEPDPVPAPPRARRAARDAARAGGARAQGLPQGGAGRGAQAPPARGAHRRAAPGARAGAAPRSLPRARHRPGDRHAAPGADGARRGRGARAPPRARRAHRARRRPRAVLLRAALLSRLRPRLRDPRSAPLLVQQPPGRLPRLRRRGRDRRPRPRGDPRPVARARERRAGALRGAAAARREAPPAPRAGRGRRAPRPAGRAPRRAPPPPGPGGIRRAAGRARRPAASPRGRGWTGARRVHHGAPVRGLRRPASQPPRARRPPLGPDDRRAHRAPRERRGAGHRRAPLRGPRGGGRRGAAQGDPAAPRLPRPGRPRLSDPRPARRHALGRRGATHPARRTARLEPARRVLHPRRAHHRAPSARQRHAARHTRVPARARQHGAGGRARRGDHPSRRPGRRPGARGGGARRAPGRRRPARAARRPPRLADRPLPGRPAPPPRAEPRPGSAPAPHGARRARAQPARHRRRPAARRVDVRDRRLRLGQVDAGARRALPGDAPRPRPPRRARGCAPRARGRRAPGARGRGRPEPDRPDAALDARLLRGLLRRHPPALRAGARGAAAGLGRRPLLVQRPGRPLRGLRGPGAAAHSDELPPRRLRRLRHLRRAALHGGDAHRPLRRAHHRRRARHDGRGSGAVFRAPSRGGARARRAGRHRPRLPDARAAEQHALGRRGPAHQARLRARQGVPRSDALRARRADHRPPLRRHRSADRRAAPPGRPRQHRGHHRAQPRHREGGRLERRPRARGRRRRRHGGGVRAAGRDRRGGGLAHGTLAPNAARLRGLSGALPRARGPPAPRPARGPVPAARRSAPAARSAPRAAADSPPRASRCACSPRRPHFPYPARPSWACAPRRGPPAPASPSRSSSPCPSSPSPFPSPRPVSGASRRPPAAPSRPGASGTPLGRPRADPRTARAAPAASGGRTRPPTPRPEH